MWFWAGVLGIVVTVISLYILGLMTRVLWNVLKMAAKIFKFGWDSAEW